MPKYGPKPDVERRKRIVELRRQGLTLREIGKRLGITRQAVHVLWHKAGAAPCSKPVACRACGAVITVGHHLMAAPPVLCLPCLEEHPDATLGERIRTFRVARGLTQNALSKLVGLGQQDIAGYEEGKKVPSWKALVKLVRVLGLEVIMVRELREAAGTGRRKQR